MDGWVGEKWVGSKGWIERQWCCHEKMGCLELCGVYKTRFGLKLCLKSVTRVYNKRPK